MQFPPSPPPARAAGRSLGGAGGGGWSLPACVVAGSGTVPPDTVLPGRQRSGHDRAVMTRRRGWGLRAGGRRPATGGRRGGSGQARLAQIWALWASSGLGEAGAALCSTCYVDSGEVALCRG
jgi:hypothetical protein